MDRFKVIAFTHKYLPFDLIGKLHLEEDAQKHLLPQLKEQFDLDELLFLSTCNRVELFISTAQNIDKAFVNQVILFLSKNLSESEAKTLSESVEIYNSENGVEHLFRVAASLDSLVVGEREIITQVRKAYDFCKNLNMTGDFMRLLLKQTIETAKDVYTNTNIAKNPVSVASLAYRSLRTFGIKTDARILLIGSGETNTTLANYLQKHKFANFTVFNRTLANAKKLATLLNGEGHELSELKNYTKGFDVLFVCTGSSTPIVTKEIFTQLLNNETSKKVIIDLALPANVSDTVAQSKQVHYIDINSLKEQAEANLQARKNEIVKCEQIIGERKELFRRLRQERLVELAFGEVPKQVKAIKELALNEVFVKEIGTLDTQSKEVLDKVLAYMEKKYNAVAIKTAKEIFLSGE